MLGGIFRGVRESSGYPSTKPRSHHSSSLHSLYLSLTSAHFADEKSRILSFPIQILVEQIMAEPSDMRMNPWREYGAKLQLHSSNQYLRALLARLLGEDWQGILLSEMSLNLRERLAIALLFLADDQVLFSHALSRYCTNLSTQQLTKYLRNTVENMNRLGDIEALLITGLTPAGLNVIQAYIDNTGDVQTAAILTSFVSPVRWKRDRKPITSNTYLINIERIERWVAAYEDLLDSWKLFHHRCAFDVLRGEINAAAIKSGDVPTFEWVPRQIMVRCNYCNTMVDPSQPPLESGPTGTANDIVRVS